jgi:uncharacterized protein YdeI (YjbR/CyaY-like superfamily)
MAGLALAAVLAGCQSGPGPTSPDTQSAGRSAWIERRAAQLSASGLSSGEAAAKAASEWSSLTGDEREAILFRYSSKSSSEAEQKKVNEGLEKLQRAK